MDFRFYTQLHQDEKMIRETVFMQEQGFENEFDERDHHCLHLVCYNQDQPIACARMFEENGRMILGRIAVLKDYRHLHVGSQLMRTLEKKAKEEGYTQTQLSAQVRAKQFYQSNGYYECGDVYLDEECPHITMVKDL